MSNLKNNLLIEIEISKSKAAMENVCSTKKICEEQGPITFGQLRELVEKGKLKRIGVHMAEGGYKAALRLVPWFLPQLVLLGFGATWIRVFNKLFRPTLEETTNYKTWWGKTVLRIFNLVEGELNASDPLSKIFFISDGLMTMLNDKYKVEFARYISEVASEQPDDEIVPEYFVENELRHWLNEKFFLDPPLQQKNSSSSDIEIKENKMILFKSIILESRKYDSLVRQIVKDIVTIYKREDDGEFYLPEDLVEDEVEYYLRDASVTVELIIEQSENVDGYLLNAEYYADDDVIIVKIIYNPETKQKVIYNMIGELNEILAHELRHNVQKNRGLFSFRKEPSEKEGYAYYTKPKELDAQYYGFKRMSRITKRPYEELVRNWFKTHKDIHQMNDKDSEKVINKLLKFKPTN